MYDDREPHYLYVNPLRPIIKNPYSPEWDIAYLREHYPGIFPKQISAYIDPFLGDGDMYFHIGCRDKRVNDYSMELIELYYLVKNRDKEFLSIIGNMTDLWSILGDLADQESLRLYIAGDDEGLARKIYTHRGTIYDSLFTREASENLIFGMQLTVVAGARRLRRIEYHNDIEDDERLLYLTAAFRAGIYNHVRTVYNSISGRLGTLRTACYYFLRRYSYKGIFRQNHMRHFTTPFAGVAANSLVPDIDIDYWYNSDLTWQLTTTTFESANCLDFLMNEDLVNDDFIFLDPPHPYRSKAFSEFPFTMQDHERLADWLIDNCKCQWLLLLKPSRVIESLYWKGKSRGIHFNYFTKGFRIRKNFMDYETKHVLIKNY